jgi:hypothetical protein
MKSILGLTAALLIATPVIAAEPPLQVSYPTDAQMDCPAINAEVARMDTLIAQTNQQVMNADGSAKGVGMASAVAVEGLVRSGLLGRVPGAGMFANSATNMAKQRAETVRANAAQTIQVAETRKVLMGGMYAGKACDAAPAPTPAPPIAPAAAPGF